MSAPPQSPVRIGLYPMAPEVMPCDLYQNCTFRHEQGYIFQMINLIFSEIPHVYVPIIDRSPSEVERNWWQVLTNSTYNIDILSTFASQNLHGFEDKLTVSFPVAQSPIMFLLPAPNPSMFEYLARLFTAFDSVAWFCGLSSMALVFSLLLFYRKLTHEQLQIWPQSREMIPAQSGNLAFDRRGSGKLLMLVVIVISGMLMTSMYQNTILISLVDQRFAEPVANFEHIVDQLATRKLKLLSYWSMNDDTRIVNEKTRPFFEALKHNKPVLMTNYDELDALMDTRQYIYADFYSVMIGRKTIDRFICDEPEKWNYFWSPSLLANDQMGLGIMMREGIDLDAINLAIIQKSEILHKIYDKTFEAFYEECYDLAKSKKLDQINLEDCYGALIILGFGLTVGFLVFIAEPIWKKITIGVE